MSKKVSFDITMEQLEQVKKVYDKVAEKDPHITFDQFLETMAKNAFSAQLQFCEMNESVTKMLDGFVENMEKTTGQDINETFKNIDNMVHDIFAQKMKQSNAGNDNKNKDASDSKKVKN